MLYERFINESAFRSDFLRPLLTRMGFLSIAELHGTQEFGKDFVFSELTPFGFVRHHAAVVKHEEAIRQSATSLCSTVLAQVRQAFSVTFRLPDTEAVNRVSSVVVFNSGRITENARHWLRSELDEEKYGRNVHILDGERLAQLDLTTSFRQSEMLIPRLQGLQADIGLNLIVWQSIEKTLPTFSESRGCFTTALEGFAAAPFLTDRINITEVITLIQECRIIDSISRRHLLVAHPEVRRNEDAAMLQSVLTKAKIRAACILTEVQKASQTFKPLSNTDTR